MELRMRGHERGDLMRMRGHERGDLMWDEMIDLI
jgi:hypothetical protein